MLFLAHRNLELVFPKSGSIAIANFFKTKREARPLPTPLALSSSLFRGFCTLRQREINLALFRLNVTLHSVENYEPSVNEPDPGLIADQPILTLCRIVAVDAVFVCSGDWLDSHNVD